jgi:deoxyribonuclease V
MCIYIVGAHVYNALSCKVPVIDVAKTNFHNNTKHVLPIYRGESKNPLYITAIDIGLQQAAGHIQHMHGEFAYRLC